MEKRKLFSQILSSAIDAKNLNMEKIWFSDEAHFWLNGYVNKQNYGFWGTEQLFIAQSEPLHSEHLMVWATMSSRDIHYLFIEENLTGLSYKNLLKNQFFSYN